MAEGVYKLDPVDHDPFEGVEYAPVPPAPELTEADKHAQAQAQWEAEEAAKQREYDASASRSVAPSLLASGSILPSYDQVKDMVGDQQSPTLRHLLAGVALPYQALASGAASAYRAGRDLTVDAPQLAAEFSRSLHENDTTELPTRAVPSDEVMGRLANIIGTLGVGGSGFARPEGSLGAAGGKWHPDAAKFLEEQKQAYAAEGKNGIAAHLGMSLQHGPDFVHETDYPTGVTASAFHNDALDLHNAADTPQASIPTVHPDWHPDASDYLKGEQIWYNSVNQKQIADHIGESLAGGPNSVQPGPLHKTAKEIHDNSVAADNAAPSQWHPDVHSWLDENLAAVDYLLKDKAISPEQHAEATAAWKAIKEGGPDGVPHLDYADGHATALEKQQEATDPKSLKNMLNSLIDSSKGASSIDWNSAAHEGFDTAKSLALKGGHMGVYDALKFIQANGPGTTVHPSHAQAPQINGMMKLIEQMHTDAGGALPGTPQGWGQIDGDIPSSVVPWSPAAQKFIQDHIYNVKDINPKLADGIKSQLLDNPQLNPESPSIDPAHPHYWKLDGIAADASDIHNHGGVESPDSTLASLDKTFSNKVYVPPKDKKSLEEAVAPIHWPTYIPPQGAVKPFVPGPNEARAQALGFNTNVPLYKGMTWHNGGRQGEGLGPSGAFADPRGKPNEPAIFAADQPAVANGYAHGGYNIAPMYARPSAPYEVNWRDIAPHGSYESTTMQALLNHVRARGGDAVVIHNIGDLGGIQTQYAFMDPASLRVRHAAFDPARLSSADLLHASPAAMALGLTPGHSIYVPTTEHREEK